MGLSSEVASSDSGAGCLCHGQEPLGSEAEELGSSDASGVCDGLGKTSSGVPAFVFGAVEPRQRVTFPVKPSCSFSPVLPANQTAMRMPPVMKPGLICSASELVCTVLEP
jgi:hypothetical protein